MKYVIAMTMEITADGRTYKLTTVKTETANTPGSALDAALASIKFRPNEAMLRAVIEPAMEDGWDGPQ